MSRTLSESLPRDRRVVSEVGNTASGSWRGRGLHTHTPCTLVHGAHDAIWTLDTTHCRARALHTVRCILRTLRVALSALCTLYTALVLCAPSTAHTAHTAHCNLQTAHSVDPPSCTLHTVHTAPCRWHTTHCALDALGHTGPCLPSLVAPDSFKTKSNLIHL